MNTAAFDALSPAQKEDRRTLPNDVVFDETPSRAPRHRCSMRADYERASHAHIEACAFPNFVTSVVISARRAVWSSTIVVRSRGRCDHFVAALSSFPARPGAGYFGPRASRSACGALGANALEVSRNQPVQRRRSVLAVAISHRRCEPLVDDLGGRELASSPSSDVQELLA
jgi:hypothetical protein